MSREVAVLANVLLERAKLAGIRVATAESCTAGLMALTLSDAEGASDFFEGGFVTYSKAQKTAALGVSRHVLRDKGAVCCEVASAMAEGALLHSGAGVAGAITGVAGPSPDEDGNPIGRVCIAVALRGTRPRSFERNYGDVGRDVIREQAVADTLNAMIELVELKSVAA